MNVERFGLVLVGMDSPEAVLVAFEVERELGKRLRRAQPHEAIRPMVDRGLDAIGPSSRRTVLLTPSAPTIKISVGELIERVDLALELEAHARSGALVAAASPAACDGSCR